MDNSNLREDQEKTIQEALMKAAAAHRFAELGQTSDAKQTTHFKGETQIG